MTNNKEVTIKKQNNVQGLLNTPVFKKRFEDMLGRRAPAFMSSIISAVNSNDLLKECNPVSVISAAAMAASMDLPISPGLGLAYIVPYGGVAQFQIGWKGFVQLAMRSGQYKTINVTPVKDGQLKRHDPFTGEMEFQLECDSDNYVGYLLYFRLLNGYEKYFYMTKEECEKHGKRYSRSFKRGKGLWVDDFDSMGLKTVVKMGLSKYGILLIDMQKAIEADQADVTDESSIKYPDAINVTPGDDTPKKEPGPSRMKAIIKSKSKKKAEPEIAHDPGPTMEEKQTENGKDLDFQEAPI